MVSGNIGAHSLGRLDYTVIGDAVNTAARLQNLAGASEILVTDAVRGLLGDGYELEDKGEVSIKGKKDNLHVFNVLAPKIQR